MAAALSAEQALEAARELAPAIRARAAETEQRRAVPDATIQELIQSGLFGIATPRAHGGSELPPHVWIEVIVELAAACGSTGWVYGVLLGHMWLVSQFPQRAQDEVFSDPESLVASLIRMGGSPEPVDGGYRWRNARGRFCSGIDHSAWVVVGGMARPGEGRWFLMPKSEIEVEDDWFTVGLRGTGSKSIHVADVFIPEHRSILQAGPTPGQQINTGPLYQLPGSTFAFPLAATSVGIAREAVRVVGEGLRRRLGRFEPHQLGDHSQTLGRYGDAATNVELGYSVLLARARRLMDCAEAPYTPLQRAEHRRDVAFSARQARESTNVLMQLSGGSGLYDDAAVERLWRDCAAAAAHASLNWDNASAGYARALLDLAANPGDPFAR